MSEHLTREHQGTHSAGSTLGAERKREDSHEQEMARSVRPIKEEPLAELTKDVRTALQSIFGAIGLLLDTLLTSEQREYTGYVSHAAHDLNNTVVRTTAELTKLADTASSRTSNSVERILATARETLGMDVSFVSQFTEDQMVFRALEGDAKSFGWKEGDEVPLDKTFCKRVIEGKLPSVISDAKNDERVEHLDITHEADIGSYVGIPLRFSNGRLYGTLCSLSHSSEPQLQERDTKFMEVLARLVADQLEREELEAENRRLEIRATELNALLVALVARDVYTGDHSHTVAHYAEVVARRMGLSEEEVDEVKQAAKLHDIGKVGIRDGLLDRPVALSETEQEDMRAHATIGAEIVSSTQELAHLAPVVRAVHERWDGEGYPDRLSGEEIPLASRIILVCDTFHAITSNRPYRPAMDPQTALEELKRHTSTQFCPSTVEAFIDEFGCGDGARVRKTVSEAQDLVN